MKKVKKKAKIDWWFWLMMICIALAIFYLINGGQYNV